MATRCRDGIERSKKEDATFKTIIGLYPLMRKAAEMMAYLLFLIAMQSEEIGVTSESGDLPPLYDELITLCMELKSWKLCW